jgi:GcrA cell cycle regulator
MHEAWTDEQEQLLRKMVSERKLTSSQMADELGKSRNAVIGKAHRLCLRPIGKKKRWEQSTAPRPPRPKGEGGITQRINGRRERTAQRLANHAFTNTAKLVPEPAPESATEPVAVEFVVPLAQRCTLFQLNDHTCRWPVGDPGTAGFYFCGGEQIEGLPYCAGHCRIAYRPVPSRTTPHPERAWFGKPV